MTGNEVDELRHRLDRLEERLNLVFGALAVLTVLGNAALAVVVSGLVS